MNAESNDASRAVTVDAEATFDLVDHVLVLAASTLQAREICADLREGAVASRAFSRVEELVTRLDEADAGALLLTVEALTPTVTSLLVAALECQPPWSDIAVVVMTDGAPPSLVELQALDELRAASNFMLLEAPPDKLTLAMTLESRLKARRRQYGVRDFLDQEVLARQQAEQAVADKDRLLAQLCHELQTPMSAILLWSRLAAAGTIPATELPRALAFIESSARSQSYLVNSLLDASELAAGRLRLNVRPVALAGIVEAATLAANPLARVKGVRLEVSIDEAVGQALADPDRMQRIVWNLLARAIKLTPAGEAVTLRLSGKEGVVRLDIGDRSERGPPSNASAEGDPMAEDAGAVARAPKGLSLGLVLGKQVLELQGGAVSAAPQPSGAGMMVSVSVPVAREA